MSGNMIARESLLFPRSGDLGSNVANYRLHPGTDECGRIDVATIDVRMKPSQIVEELKPALAGFAGQLRN